MRRFVTFCCICAALSLQAQRKAKTDPAPDRFAGMDTMMEHLLRDAHAAGLAVAVVQKDKVIYSHGFGYRDYEKKLPVTPSTLFAIGSCTKAFTSSLMGTLHAAGKVDYDEPARTYLPTLRFYNDEMTNNITVRDLMSHRTGLPRYDISWYMFPGTSRDSLLKRVQYMAPTARIREKWQYNNFMFLLQGMIAEKVTGRSWETNVSDGIFRPLQMNSSGFSIHDLEKSDDAAMGYGVKKDSVIKKINYFNITGMGPCGSINSNVNDMARWVTAWINGGKYEGKQILPAAYVKEAITSQMVIPGGLPVPERPDLHFSNYGFAWMLSSYRGHYRVEHGGNIDGFSAEVAFYPSDSLGIVVLSNQNASAVPPIALNLFADRLLNLPYYNWIAEVKKAQDKLSKAMKELEKAQQGIKRAAVHASHPLADYEGVYSNPAFGSFEVAVENDSLVAHIANQSFWLSNYHYDVFDAYEKNAGEPVDTSSKNHLQFQFLMNTAGDITSASVPLEPTMSLPSTFNKTPRAHAVAKDELQKYAGDYELAGGVAKVYVKDNTTLYVVVPGQADYELIPVGGTKFALKVLPSFFVEFEMNDRKEATGIAFIQPNGTFKGTKKK